MNSIPLLGVILLLPAFALMAWLGVVARRAQAKSMLLWSLAALLVAVAGCLLGEIQPGRGGHVLWPQVAAATFAFVGFVSVWGLGLWFTRTRAADGVARMQ